MFNPEDFELIDMSEPKNTCRYGLLPHQSERIAERANQLYRERALSLECCGYTFSVMSCGSLWVGRDDGEGMQLSKASLDKFWRENF